MSDERTYGFSFDDAQSLLQGISHGESIYPEIRPRGGGGGGGAARIVFITESVECDVDDNPVFQVNITAHTSTATPYGIDELTGFATVVDDGCVTLGIPKESLLAKEGTATLFYKLDGSPKYWKMDSICYDPADANCL